MRRSWNWMFTLLLAAALAGCKGPPPTTPVPAQTLHILATVYPLADIARQVGGQWVSVDWIIEGANDPRDIQPSDLLTRKMNDANFIVTSGFDDVWAAQDLVQEMRARRLIRLEETPAGREDARQAAGQAALWLDPVAVQQLGELIRDRLDEREPEHADEFRANAAALRGQLQQLIDEHKPKLAAVGQKKFLVLRPVWSALAGRFGLEEEAPINARPEGMTDRQARDLRDAAAADGTHLLVLDSLVPPAARRDLQNRTGLTLLELDLLGSSARSGHRTYRDLLEYDLEQLERALSPATR